MLGLHATHIIDVGGRVGYFAELRRRRAAATSRELAQSLGLDPWRTEVWCRAACVVGVLRYEGAAGFGFAPFMEALLAQESPELLTVHALASLAGDFPDYPEAFRTGATRTFQQHGQDFFERQSRLSALRAPEIVAAARAIPQLGPTLARGCRVLDVGCGSGTVPVSFAETFARCEVVGVEPLPYFAARARDLIRERGLQDRVRVELMGAEEIEFEAEFDLVTLVQVFHELPDRVKLQILKACRRGLRPGGFLMLVDRCAPETGADLQDRRFTMSVLEQWMEVTWGNVVNTRTEILAALREAGFAVVAEDGDAVPTYWTFAATGT